MKFEIGKVYRHKTGRVMKIVGVVQSTTRGLTLIGEQLQGQVTFFAVGSDESATLNWEAVGDEVWEAQFSE